MQRTRATQFDSVGSTVHYCEDELAQHREDLDPVSICLSVFALLPDPAFRLERQVSLRRVCRCCCRGSLRRGSRSGLPCAMR